MRRKPIWITLQALIASSCWVQPAWAETTASFDVTASITAGCLVDGVGGSGSAGTMGQLDFGRDTTFSTASHSASLTSTQAIRLRCTPGVDLTMTIDGGSHASAGKRHLQKDTEAAARVAYTICSDGACNQPIAIGGSSPIAVSSANTNDVRLPIYGLLTLPGGLPAGTYTDNLLVTLHW